MDFTFNSLSINMSYISDMDKNFQEIKAEAQEYDDDGKLHTIAMVKIKRVIYLGAKSHDNNFFDFDCISEQMYRLFEYCLIEDEDGLGGSKFINDEHDEFQGLIYIEELRVNKEYRRVGIGKALVHEVIKMIGNYDDILIVLPFPIEANGNEKAHKKVINFWEKIGFTQVDDTDFWYMACHDLKERRDFIEEVEFKNKKQYNFKEVMEVKDEQPIQIPEMDLEISKDPINNLHDLIFNK